MVRTPDDATATRIDPDDVDFDAHAIAAAWEAADDVPVSVAVSVTNEFTHTTVFAADGHKSDGDVVFTPDDAPDVLFEEKTVGVCDRDVARSHATAFVDLPNRDDGTVLAISPGQIFVDDRDDRPTGTTPTDAEIAEAFGVDDVDDITDEMVDVPDVPDTVDVSDYKTAGAAAATTHKALRKHAESMQHDPDAVRLYDPDETQAKRDVRADGVWCVSWEGGPQEWAIALTGGESLTAFTGPGGFGDDPEVAGLTDGAGFDVECYYSFDLLFSDK